MAGRTPAAYRTLSPPRSGLLWLLLFAAAVAAVAFVVWASMARPWAEPPSEVTPPLTGW